MNNNRRANQLLLLAVFFAAAPTAAIAGTEAGHGDRPPVSAAQSKRDRAAVLKWAADQSGCPERKIEINRLDYFDFKHDGKIELIVVASTCNTGTAGPDVHAILEPSAHGGFEELPVPDVDRKYFDAMILNYNYDFGVDGDMLVEIWQDRGDRGKYPLVVKYRWDGAAFVVSSIDAPYLK